MGCRVEESCKECTRKCLLIHGKKKHPSPEITSFFKVMIGDQFSKVLYLPPKFARTVSDLVSQKIHLEDSSGQQWKVTLSNLNGSFAFHQGWNVFALDHGLEVGDFVVFHYIVGSGFVVKIYSKTGCEKLDFSAENSSRKKRAWTKKNSIAKDGSCHTIDISSMNKQCSSTSAVSDSDIELIQSQCDAIDVEEVPMAAENTSNCENSNGRPQPVCKAVYVEEPFYMIDRDLTLKQGEYRSSIFDLSNFEMHKNIPGDDESNRVQVGDERSPHPVDTSLRSQSTAGLVDKDPVAEEVVTRVVPSDASDFEVVEIKNDCEVLDKIASTSDKHSCNGETSQHLLPTSAMKLGENRKANPRLSSKVIKKCQIAESERMMMVKKEHVEEILEQSAHEEMIQDIHGKALEVMKKGQGHSSNLAVKENENAFKVVKTETVDLIDLSSSLATNISCLVATGSQSFLPLNSVFTTKLGITATKLKITPTESCGRWLSLQELPMCLPSASLSHRGRTKMDRKVVFLRDPIMRLWPVLYLENVEKLNVKALTSGWEAFSKANNIQPGDQCVFGVENEAEGIYGVRINRR